MSVDIVYKIRDKTTGLYWGGPKLQCTDQVGTRFARWSMVEQVVNDMYRLHGGFPENWEILTVKLKEEIEFIRDHKQISITHMIEQILMKRSAEFGLNSHVMDSLLTSGSFMKLRRNQVLKRWTHVFYVPISRYSNVQIRAELSKKFGDIEGHMTIKDNRWVFTDNAEIASTAVMMGLTEVCIDINNLRGWLAEKIGCEPEAIW
jgi:hypothetical protein